jgi:DNA primase
MSSSVEQIKEKLSIVDVISSYLKIEKAGGNYKAICPFHNEKSPSFFISPSRNSYYCFGCGAKGDIFSFVEQFEGLDFKGALQVLALRAGVTLEPYRGSDPKERNEKDRLYELMESATVFYQKQFQSCADAKKYIEDRGVTKETIEHFRIGYAPAEWRMLSDFLRANGFTDKEIVLSGLAKHPDDKPNGEIYDRFRDRVMFPMGDSGARIIAFSGRILHDDGSGVQGKYINSPETPIFKKGSVLYGLDKAKFEIRKRDLAILVEGQMDLVLSHQAGFTNTVASSGTALGDSLIADNDKGALTSLGQVHALSKNLTIAFDADKAGMKAAGRAERIGLSLGMNVKVAKLPADLDPADVIRKEGKEVWKKIIEGAQHIVLFYLTVLEESKVSEHTRMRAIRDKILPYIAVMPSAVERVHFIREIHLKTGIPEEALAEDVVRLLVGNDLPQKKPAPASNIPTQSVSQDNSRTAKIEERLFGILIWQEECSPPLIDLEPFRKRLEAVMGNEGFKNSYGKSQEKKQERIFEVETLYDDPKRLNQDTEELLDNLEEEKLGRDLEDLMQKMNESEQFEGNASMQEILQESQRITTRLNTIKSSRFKH